MMEEVIIKDLKVKYERIGEGSPLLILHGWGASSSSWEKVRENLSGFEVIIPDLPGFGKSDAPNKPWTIQNYLKFISDFVSKINLDQFYLVGHSFGGSLAVKFAVNYPEAVKKMILIGSAGIKPEPKLKAKIVKYLAQKSDLLLRGPLIGLKKQGRRFLSPLIEHTDYGRASPMMKETMKNIFDYYSNLGENSGGFLEDLERLKQKVLLVWGEEDEIISVRYGEIFRERINNSELRKIPQVGHSPHLEKPSQTAHIISQYFNEMDA